MTTDERAMKWANKQVERYCHRNGITKDDPRHFDDIERIADDALDEFYSKPL